MKCLRCGYCCFHYSVIIVDDPDKGVEPDNLKGKMGVNERCQHIRGDTPGEYICAIHDKDWYPETPCFQHGQVESSDLPCRMGTYILGKGIELTKDWQGSIIMKCPKCKQDVVSEHDRCCSSCDHSFSGAEISYAICCLVGVLG